MTAWVPSSRPSSVIVTEQYSSSAHNNDLHLDQQLVDNINETQLVPPYCDADVSLDDARSK